MILEFLSRAALLYAFLFEPFEGTLWPRREVLCPDAYFIKSEWLCELVLERLDWLYYLTIWLSDYYYFCALIEAAAAAALASSEERVSCY